MVPNEHMATFLVALAALVSAILEVVRTLVALTGAHE